MEGVGVDKSGRGDQDCRQRLAWLASRQLGVVSLEQLYCLGFSYEQVRRMVATGTLHRLFHGAYAVGHDSVIDRAHLLAAQLSLGPRAFLSHRSAAAIHGLRPVNIHDIELTVVGSAARKRSRLTIHRTATEPHGADVKTSGLFRVSSVLRALVELSPRETPGELERLVTVAVQKRLLRLDVNDGRADVEAALERHKGWPGTGKLAAVLAPYRRADSSKSELERAFDRLLAKHPEIPQPQRNVHIDIWEIDRFWPQHRLAVELDGRPYHVAVRDMERDRVKDAALQKLGLVPLRFTDHRFDTDGAGILRDLRHFLGLTVVGRQRAAV